MKRLVFGLVFIALGLFSINYFSKMENASDDELKLRINKNYEEQILDINVRKLVNRARSLSDLEQAEVEMRPLSQQYKDRVTPMISLKKASLLFEQAEDYLRKAIEIENAVVSPGLPPPMPPANDPENHDNEPIPPPQQSRELHPLTQVNLNKAIELYEKARKESEKIKDTGDPDFDYHNNYLKGEIYYRLLELIADQDSAQELFNQTLTYYKYALRSKNNDINTVINIEILIKNQNGLLGNAANPQRKKQMLNSKKYGIGKSSGN